MKVKQLHIKAANKFATNYLNEAEEVMSFFNYTFKDPSNFEKRKQDLNGRSFDRAGLVKHIESFMKDWMTPATQESLRKLALDSSVVVIGGQQAGLFTGPLYSIHKVLSVLQLAKQQEEKLNVPVIPVFWIAGEDHDYQEVNHVFLHNDKEVKKFVDTQKLKTKPMVSHIELNKGELEKQLDEMVSFLGETQYSKQLLSKVKQLLAKSDNYVDLFSAFIMELFKDTPLLLVDSGNKEFKQLQKQFLTTQIENAKEITESVLSQQKVISQAGYPLTLDISENSANLFFYDEERKERILLECVDGLFVNTQKGLSFTREEMLHFAINRPEVLSNNVVTRPLMQEWLFPTLAFIGGPGEISYWAELKQVFEHFHMNMPIIVPRINITLIDQHCLSKMDELHISLEEALDGMVDSKKQQKLAGLRDLTIPNIISATEEMLHQQYEMMKENNYDAALMPILEKNERLIKQQLDFLNKKVERSFLLKEDTLIRKYDYVSNHLYPQHTYQERKLNVIQFLNEYGFNFVKQLTEVPLNFDGSHHVIEI